MTKDFDRFLDEYEKQIIPLSEQLNRVNFEASISGEETEFKKAGRLHLELSKIFTDKESFKKLKEFKESGEITDPVKKRELDLIYNDFASHHYDEELLAEIISISTKIEEKFSTARAEVDGKEFTDNEIEDILSSS